MIFPVYNYKNFHNENKHLWPIKPVYGDLDINRFNKCWSRMLSENYKYCKNLRFVFEFKGKCASHNLPSEHPYWIYQLLLDGDKNSDRIKNNIKKIKENIHIKDIVKLTIGTAEYASYSPNSAIEKLTIELTNGNKEFEEFLSTHDVNERFIWLRKILYKIKHIL